MCSSDLLQQLRSKIDTIAIRSKNESVTEKTQVYIADTFGELNRFIAGAEFVIMGGSFVPLGGQNILECARQSRAVIFGPYMDNFSDEANLFLEYGAGLQVKDTTELSEKINLLASDKNKCQQLSNNGNHLLGQYSHIIDHYMQELATLCPCFKNSSQPDN